MRIQRAAQHPEFTAHSPNQLRAGNHCPTHDVSHSRGVLGQAVDEHVDVVLAVLMEPREGVVHYRERTRRLGKAGQCANVRDLGDGVGRALEEHHARGGRRERSLDRLEILDREHRMLHTETVEETPNQIATRVIRLDEANDVVTLLRQSQQRLRDRPDPRGGDQTVLAPLQFGQ